MQTTSGLKVAKLIKVEAGANNNKFYNMFELGDGTFRAEWGRVGGHTSEQVYSMTDWDKKYREKLSDRKGYKDQTELFAIESTAVKTKDGHTLDIKDKFVKSLIEDLMAFANESIKKNYTVTADAVTQKQVDEAQSLIDEITKMIDKLDEGDDVNYINEQLVKLYSIIPRKMAKVSQYLFNENDDLDMEGITWGKKLIQEEQATLDVMKGQVWQPATSIQPAKKVDPLTKYGIQVTQANDKDVDIIKKLLKNSANKFKKAYRVVNLKTQPKFDDYLGSAPNKKKMLLWHGSRNQNWWNIMKLGLMLNPAATITGKMFGHGIYFADKAQKSIGYTSLRGSYWAGGSDNKAYLAIYEVHVGKWLHKQKHQSWMSSLNYKSLQKYGQYDSLFAEGGVDLVNNEYIIYKEEQCTIKYLVEIGN